jgi:hypothetical protein
VLSRISGLRAIAVVPNWQGRYDRMTDTMCNLTGEAPTNMRDFVKLHAPEFKQRGPAHS